VPTWVSPHSVSDVYTVFLPGRPALTLCPRSVWLGGLGDFLNLLSTKPPLVVPEETVTLVRGGWWLLLPQDRLTFTSLTYLSVSVWMRELLCYSVDCSLIHSVLLMIVTPYLEAPVVPSVASGALGAGARSSAPVLLHS